MTRMEQELIGYKEAAAMLGVAVGTLYSWVSRHRIPHIRMSGRCVRFDKTEIGEWISGNSVPATEEGANGS